MWKQNDILNSTKPSVFRTRFFRILIVLFFQIAGACDKCFAIDDATVLGFAGKKENLEVFRRLLPFQFANRPNAESIQTLQLSLKEIPNWEEMVWARLVELDKEAGISKAEYDKFRKVLHETPLGNFDIAANMAAQKRLNEISEQRYKMFRIFTALAISRLKESVRLIGPFLESQDMGWDYGDAPQGDIASNAALALYDFHLRVPLAGVPPIKAKNIDEWQKWWRENKDVYGAPLKLPISEEVPQDKLRTVVQAPSESPQSTPVPLATPKPSRQLPLSDQKDLSWWYAAGGFAMLGAGIWVFRRRKQEL